MALHFISSLCPPTPNPNLTSYFLNNISCTNNTKNHLYSKTISRSLIRSAAAPSQEPEQQVTPPGSSSSSSARSQIDLLDQLTSSSSSNDGSMDYSQKLTIRQQLSNTFSGRDDDFTIPLGKNLKKVTAAFLTISQKRNIKRQTCLNEVSQRNDSVFFATIGAFILLPPVVILGIAIATGYVQLFP
uniref:Uncharacterized protein n=1 Tax=Sedum alfredii TaxID=439688 RepID=A0A8E4V0G2_9MAGN|nr:hypothetical protein [Sedum alfredii]